MIAFLTYDLKVAVLITAFYMFYRLLLTRETFHSVNRAVLLLTAVASFVLPLCVITFHKKMVVESAPTAIDIGALAMVVEDAQRTPLWQTLLVATFFVGLAVTLGYTLMSVLRVWMLIRRSQRYPQPDGTTVCVVTGDVSPFSWMRYIVLSRRDYEANDASILAHERGHICRHHSLDLLLVDTLTALQWFNPAMWMLRQDLRAIHEYEADAAVLSQGINMRQYQYLLIQKAVSHCGYSVANGISHSTLKNRIEMMHNKKSNSASLLKLLALVPIVGVALALQAETVIDYVYETPQTPQKKVVKKGRKDAKVKMNNTTIEVKAEEPQDKAEATPAPHPIEDVKIVVVGEAGDKEPLIVIDSKASTREQLLALEPKVIDNVSVVKNEEVLKVYAKHFNDDTSNGIIFVNTKEYVKNGKKEIVSVNVKAKEPQEDHPTAIGTFTPDTPETENAFNVVEQMPEFPGGAVELMKFLSENVKYPEAAEKTGTQGRVIAQFIVEADGSITNVKVVKNVTEELDAETVRVINAMPKWKPGMQKGQPVRVKYTIPVTFRLK
jgi:TonB family protein